VKTLLADDAAINLWEYTQVEVKMTRILIADPDINTRKALALLLKHKMGVDAICEADDAASLARLVNSFCPDILLLSDALPGIAIQDACPQLRKIVPSLWVALLSVRESAVETARLNHMEFIHKGASLEQTLNQLSEMIGRSI
jgi:DNA-binding NarL/FixJ family response regulator